jgi:tetratricopeptide (TPR) repeat protein
MIRLSRSAVAALALAGALVSTGCQKLQSRDNLNKGVQAYKSARYNDAVEYFKKAIELDDTNPNARLYLATAYMTQWIPGAESPENKALAEGARREFMTVLSKDPNDKTALASLASLSYNEATSLSPEEKVKKFDEAREWHQKLLAVDPQNKESYYSLGVIAWAKWYPALMGARAKLGMKPEDPGPIKDKKVKEELTAKYSAIIEEGIKSLEKAIEIDPEYDDAMAYMNLLIRERADLADSADAYKKDIDTADMWVQKTLDTKKAKAAKASAAAAANQISADK